MSNQQRCCILGVCCVPFSAEQEAALAGFLYEAMTTEEERNLERDGDRLGLITRCHRAARQLYAEHLIRQAG